MNKLLILFALLCLVAAACKPTQHDLEQEVLITVKRNYKAPKKEKVDIVIDWQDLQSRFSTLNSQNLSVINQHFGHSVDFSLSTQTGKTQQLIIHAELASNEPVFTFKISNSGSNNAPTIDSLVEVNNQLSVNFLSRYEGKNAEKSIAEQIAESSLLLYPEVKDFTIISPGKWTYEHGFFLNAVYELAEAIQKPVYIDYTKQWADFFITEEGEFRPGVYNQEEYRLDDILPGRLLLNLYEHTQEAKYKSVADVLVTHLQNQPKTSEGGYWHKEIYTNQMWLDGIYMGDVFATQYAKMMNQPHWFDEAALQIKLMHAKTHDPVTGLYFHGWDESINPVWAHPEKGHSPEFWSRAIGWYLMALVDCLENLPANHPEHNAVLSILQNLSASVLKYQADTGLWYQVMNKAEQEGNWQETSCTAMFAYAFAKAHRLGWLDQSYLAAAQKAYNGIVKNHLYKDEAGILYLDQTGKVASLNLKNSKGDYDYYINCERRINDYKGLGALLYAAIELEHRANAGMGSASTSQAVLAIR